MGKRNWWWWATGVACGLAVVGVATFALTSDERRLDTGDKIGSVVSALFGVVSLVVAVVALRGSRTAGGSNTASQFTSAPSDAHMLTGIWHHYHLTAANGRYEWRRRILRLAVDHASTTVRGQVLVPNETGRQLAYDVEAGIRGSTAVLMFTSDEGGPDAAAVEMFPELRKSYTDRHCGIACYETWNRIPIVGKCLLSRAEQVTARSDGSVEESEFAVLEEHWQRGFAGQARILPSATDQLAPRPHGQTRSS